MYNLFTPPKTAMTTEKQQFEDAFRLNNSDFPWGRMLASSQASGIASATPQLLHPWSTAG